MGLLSGLFGEKLPARSPREILAECIADISDPSLVPRALAVYDAPQELVDEWEATQGELPQWADTTRLESAAQLAYQVLNHVLSEDNRMAILDWSAGAEDIEVAVNRMFARASLPPIKDDEKASMARDTFSCKRGESLMALWRHLEEFGQKRGLAIHRYFTDGDWHQFMYVKKPAYEKWRRARFGKGVAVLP